MKILFFISSLRAGGAERVASLLCNYWSKCVDKKNKIENLEISLLTLDLPENDFYRLNNYVKRYWIGNYCIKSNILKRIWLNLIRLFRIRKTIALVKPDVIVSFMDIQNIVVLVASLFIDIPVVISERTYPQYYSNGDLFDWIRKKVYKLSDAFVAQTNDVAMWAQDFLCAVKIKVIPNPLNGNILKNEEFFTKENCVLAVGRLCKEKGFDLLIEAYCKCCKDYPQWKLLIVGDGEERKNLEEQIAGLKLDENVILVGQVNNPEIYYRSSRIFVLSSRVEGFPNVLLEAMAYGLPVISFDCKAGPSDLIRKGVNGLLVPNGDVSALSEAIKKLIDSESLRQSLSSQAVKTCDQYDIESVSKQWITLLREVVDERKKRSQ